ncbi:uncharacterized protein BDV17DRAFT_245304 [Aspergillus undulatus]|uniref:uncharacterized protein n=1 Tax=Aspergillus undulatus TaxID=1810928 RepID=UPI003CCD2086
MFCPCARSYLMVDGPHTEQPRLVRSRFQQVSPSSSRAPLPMQVRPQSAREDARKECGQAQGLACTYGSVSSHSRQGLHVRSRTVYDQRGSSRPWGILKTPTRRFPFAHETQRESRTIRRTLNADNKSNEVRIEVGRSSPSPSPDPPASDVVKIRVFRRDGNVTPVRGTGIMMEEVRLRKGDIVVRDARSEVLRMHDIEPPREWELPGDSQW